MHILIAVLGAVAAALWAFTHFVGAAREGRDAVRDVRGFFRSGKWSSKVNKRLIENIEDPRESAAVLLYQVASYDGAVTDRQKSVMLAEMRRAFGADDETAEGLYAFARMALGEINDAGNSLKKILRPVADACTDEEHAEFVAMLETVGEVEGPLTDTQRRLIEEARRILVPPR